MDSLGKQYVAPPFSSLRRWVGYKNVLSSPLNCQSRQLSFTCFFSHSQPAKGKENMPATTFMKREVTSKGRPAKSVLQPTSNVHSKQTLVKGSTLSALQRVNHPVVPTALTQPPSQNATQSSVRAYTVTAPQASLGATTQPLKQSRAFVKPAVHKSTVKFGLSSAPQMVTHTRRTAAKSAAIATQCVVGSVGLVAQTKKGTFPSTARQRNVKSNPTSATTASNTNQAQSTSAPSAPKTHLSTAPHKPFQCGSAALRPASTDSWNPPQSRSKASTVGNKMQLSARAVVVTGPGLRVGKPNGALQGKPAKTTAHDGPVAKKAGNTGQAPVGLGLSAGAKTWHGGSRCGTGSACGPRTQLVEKERMLKEIKADVATRRTLLSTRSTTTIAPQTLPRCGTCVDKVPGLQGCRGAKTEGKRSTAAQEERM